MGHQSQFHKLGEIEMAKGISLASSIASFSTQGRFDLYDIRKSNPSLNLIWTIFLFGNKKFLAYPGLTVTVSPIAPNFLTVVVNITFMM